MGFFDSLFGGDEQTATSTMDPEMKGMYMSNLGYAQQVANQLGERQFAGFTPTYQEGEALARQAATGAGVQNLGMSADLTKAVAPYAPQQVGADPAAIQAYMNPYTQEVIDTTMGDLERQRLMQQNIGGAQATAAGAFGGSRHGIAEAETNRAFADQAARTSAQLRNLGFQTASQQAQQAAIQNQAAGLQGAQMRMQAAGQLGNIAQAQQAAGLQGAQALTNLGLARQQLSQQQMDAARGLGKERLGIMTSALSGTPVEQTTTTTSDPGLFGYLTGAANIYKAFQ